MEEAAQADRIIMLNKGDIIANDEPSYLKEQLNCQTLEEVFISLMDKEVMKL